MVAREFLEGTGMLGDGREFPITRDDLTRIDNIRCSRKNSGDGDQ